MYRKPIKKISDKLAANSKKYKKLPRLRGVKDVLFDEHQYWDLIMNKARDLAVYYGFNPIEIPALERVDLYEKISGKNTDLFSKELYTFIDRGGDKVALRPEATPSLVRAYIEHGMYNFSPPVKMFWIGPLFRYAKPQAGHLRQHSQFDLEIFGEDSPVADAQLILIAYNLFSELQIPIQTQINSIGCAECRAEYIKTLMEFYRERGKRSKLCQECKKKFIKSPLKLLACTEEECCNVRDEAPQIVDYLCSDCREHFIKVLEYLDELDIPYNLNPFLIRDLDYYNRTVFEFTSALDTETEEAVSGQTNEKKISLGGGGRYDSLIEKLCGRPTPACGFGIGVERVVQKIKEKNIPLKKDKNDFIFLAQLGDQARRKMFALFEEMRRAGFMVRQSFTKDSLKAQLEEAVRIGARYSLILGQKELLDGTIIIRDMDAGTQEVIDYKKIYAELNKRSEAENEENN